MNYQRLIGVLVALGALERECNMNIFTDGKPDCRRCEYEGVIYPYCHFCVNGDNFVDAYAIAEEITKNKEAKSSKFYDAHYVSLHQPVETMQANMSPEAFQGFLRGNIIKYACRMGKKDAAEKEAQKICRYAEWLLQAIKGETIDPRKD